MQPRRARICPGTREGEPAAAEAEAGGAVGLEAAAVVEVVAVVAAAAVDFSEDAVEAVVDAEEAVEAVSGTVFLLPQSMADPKHQKPSRPSNTRNIRHIIRPRTSETPKTSETPCPLKQKHQKHQKPDETSNTRNNRNSRQQARGTVRACECMHASTWSARAGANMVFSCALRPGCRTSCSPITLFPLFTLLLLHFRPSDASFPLALIPLPDHFSSPRTLLSLLPFFPSHIFSPLFPSNIFYPLTFPLFSYFSPSYSHSRLTLLFSVP